MEGLNRLTEPIYKKIEEGKVLSKAEFVLLFIERLFYLSWESKGSFRGGFDLRFKRSPLRGKIEKILIIQPSSIGDVVYSTPLVRGLRERYPTSRISYLIEKEALPIVTGNQDLDEVIILKREEWIDDFKRRPFRDVVSSILVFIKELEERRFDLVINLHAAPRCAILSYLLRPKNISGLTVNDFGLPVMTGSVWIVYKYYITTNRPMQKVSRLSLPELLIKIGGAAPSVRKTRLFVDPDTKLRMDTLLRSLGVREGELLIGLNPGANFKARRWWPHRYARLGDILIKDYGARVILFGGQGEVDLVNRIVKMMKEDPINLAGRTSLSELAALIKRCDHFITNDTGPMHIAGACKTKTIVLAGPTRTGPYGEGHLLLQADLPCIGCGPTSDCERRDCMTAISVEMVIEAFLYQRRKTNLPVFKGVNLYSSCDGIPQQLFSYHPTSKVKKPSVVDILGLLSLNLWIEENNALDFNDKLIGPDEILRELLLNFEVDGIKDAIEDSKTKLYEWTKICEDGLRLLLAIDRGDLDLIDGFNRLNISFNTTLAGRILNLFDILYPEDENPPLNRQILLYKKKIKGLRLMEDLLRKIKILL